MTGELTPPQLWAIQFTERFTSALSVLGFLFIVYTYIFCRGFEKPINRLIFYASWSNLGTTIAGLIAHDGINAGQDSALCQFQAFMIQLFQGADVYWALCMSFNVYLALFYGWTTHRMSSQEWKYLSACYGLSIIPAIVYFFVNSGDRGRIYGPATIWCWIVPNWSFLRVATLYGIVWLALAGALGIYSIALTKAWHHRRALIGLLNPLNEDPFGGVITTDIEVVFSMANGRRSAAFENLVGSGSVPEGRPSLHVKEGSKSYTANVQGAGFAAIHNDSSRPEILRIPSLTRNAALAEDNHESWLYARVAFLYFVVMIICWTPASINRLATLIDPQRAIFGLNYTAILFLPLQGFLNALVYCVSSQTGVRNLFRRKTRDAERIPDSYSGGGALVFQDANPYQAADPGSKLMKSHRGWNLSSSKPQWSKTGADLEGDTGKRSNSMTVSVSKV